MRNLWVHVKVSGAERQDWQAQAVTAGLTVADLIRQRLAVATVDRAPRRPPTRRADPALLAGIARVGNNLNQLAKWANTHKGAGEAVQVLVALAKIEHILLSYRPGVSGAKLPTD
ncbi:MAG: plasmid mobilization relaxosome protein MobC [Rhodocyclaceae bacterium]|nr:plasmid mobilization relaxosome protein MobC [Rhodocyclaceae bacterium]